MDKDVGGFPLWVWVAAGGVVLLAAWYFTRKPTTKSGTPATAPAGGAGKETSTFKETIRELHSPPRKVKK
jgi:hypothetical protein